jgi:glycosyltransferase involved in cell wall biosynthesis
VKVLYIASAYPRGPGDVITPWLVETIHRLKRRGVDVEVLAPAYRGLADQEIDGVRVHRFRYAPAAWETLTHDQTAPDRIRERPYFLGLVPSYVAAGSAAAARLARTGDFDLVHAFWPVPHGAIGAAAKRASGVPLISTFFGVELTWLESQSSFLRPVLRGIVRASDAVTVISTYTGERLRASVPDARPVVIPFGAAVEPHAQPEHGAAVRDESAPFTLLFVGRLVERKGVHVLLEALARLTDAERPVRLEVIGNGPERPALEAQASSLGLGERVRFRGFVAEGELERALAGSDALVLPAVVDRKGDVEGLGVVLLEALAHGTPVIASAAGGITDIVRDRETGLLVPPADAAALAEAIRIYRDDPALASRLAESGRRYVEENFSWPSIIDRLVALYARVARLPAPEKAP